jgi:uncharacterized membrane protein
MASAAPLRFGTMKTQAVENVTSPDGLDDARDRRWSGHLIGVAAVTGLVAAIYSVYSLVLYATYRDSSYDLVIFDEAVRSYAHFHAGISIIKGVHNGFGPHFSVLGDHFSPILATLAPLYWIYNGPQTLLVAQAVLFALAIPPLWVFARRAFGGTGWKAASAAYLVAIAYGLSWPVASAVAFDFHEVAFAPVLTALALERLQAGRLRQALVAMGFLLLVKEDMGLLIAGIGVYLLVSRTVVGRQRLAGAVLVVVGIAYSAFATYVLIPAFGGRADYYWAYSSLGSDVPQVLGYMLRHPISALRTLVSPAVKLHTMKWLLIVFCFLPLLSPILLAVLPLLAERMLNTRYPNWWATGFQYNAYLVVVLSCAAVDGAARLDRLTGRAWAALRARRDAAGDRGWPLPAGAVALTCCAAIFAATVYAVPDFPLGQALHAQFYRQTKRSLAAAAADSRVPSGVLVEAANDLGPELSSRDTVLLWDGEQAPLGSPWIVADIQRHEMTFAGVRAQRARVTLLLSSGYKIVFSRDGFLVLHHAGVAASGTTHGGI